MSFVIPRTFRKLVVRKLTPVFRDAVDIVQQNVVLPRSREVLIKNKFLGINSSDIKAAAGCYFKENLTPPFEVGFEGIGEIVAVGDKVSELKYGQPVMHMKYGAFSEYVYVPEEDVIPIAATNQTLLPLLVSGATASLSLDKCGLILPGDKVLITAAAGAAGHIAVQWAKYAGCHVIGTCSSEDKVQFLKGLGCDRPVNEEKESLVEILHKEYPNGVNVVWDSIGGNMSETLFKHLAVKGRMVIIDGPPPCDNGSEKDKIESISKKLLQKSCMLCGFFLPHFKSDVPHYLSLLVSLLHEQALKLHVDDGSSSYGKPFKGLEDVSKAVEYLQNRRSKGKVIVHL